MNSPAFKEWQVVVDALLSGRQTLILRKGGIAEDHGEFKIEASRFWLFPTRFHAQLEKTKPSALDSSASAAPASTPPASPSTAHPPAVQIRGFAEVVHTRFLSDWAAVTALDPLHIWTEATVRQRFDWGLPPGVHLIVVRVHQLVRPFELPISPEMSGCKSWIDLPASFEDFPSRPALSDADFDQRLTALPL